MTATVIKLERYVIIAVLEGELFANEVSTFGLNVPNETLDEYHRRMDYHEGLIAPRFPMPAIPLRVVMNDMYAGYKDMIYIDDVSDPDDPIMVCAWDFFDGKPAIGKRGEYTRVYSEGK